MPKKKTETIKDDPALIEPQAIDVAGETYTVKRLGFKHVFRVGRILRNGMHVLGDERFTPGQMLQVLIACMTEAEDEVMHLIADLLGVNRKALDDPERFPMASFPELISVIAENQDLQDFLAGVEKALEKMPAAKTA